MNLKNNTKLLVKAVFSNNFKETKRIIEEGNFDTIILDDAFKALGIKYCDYSLPPIPLYYVSLCNHIYLSSNDWSKKFQPTVNLNLKGCKKLIAYWSELGYYVTTPIDFSRYSELVAFYSIYDFEDIVDGTEEQLRALGYNIEEAKLCYAIASYDQETIYRLLEQKVNPDVWICGDMTPAQCAEEEDGANGMRYVDGATSVDPQLYGLHHYYRHRSIESLEDVTSLDFHSLFMGAAYQQIYEKIVELGLSD